MQIMTAENMRENIRVFTEPYFHVFCLYTGKYGSVTTFILISHVFCSVSSKENLCINCSFLAEKKHSTITVRIKFQ